MEATEVNINDLYNDAKDAKGDDDALLGPDDLPEGETVTAKLFSSTPKVSSKGGQGFQNVFEVVEGPAKGGKFIDSIWFSSGTKDSQKAYNKRMFNKLMGAGLTEEFFQSNPSPEAIAGALKGTVLNVKIRWQKPNEDGRVFMDNTTTWSLPEGSGGGYVPAY